MIWFITWKMATLDPCSWMHLVGGLYSCCYCIEVDLVEVNWRAKKEKLDSHDTSDLVEVNWPAKKVGKVSKKSLPKNPIYYMRPLIIMNTNSSLENLTLSALCFK